MLSMALSMTLGRDLTGFVGDGSVDRRKVLMISNEDSEGELILRLRGICKGAGLSGEEEQVLKVLRAGIIRSEPLRLILAKQEVSPRPKQQPQQQRPFQQAQFGFSASWQDCCLFWASVSCVKPEPSQARLVRVFCGERSLLNRSQRGIVRA